jgi:hypothetical protein
MDHCVGFDTALLAGKRVHLPTKLTFLLPHSSYLIYFMFRASHDNTHLHDTFKIEMIIVPCFLLALVANYEFSILEVRLRVSGLGSGAC